MQAIDLSKCLPGHAYRLKGRWLRAGVFMGGKEKRFIGIHNVQDKKYLNCEWHRQASYAYGTTNPLEDLGPCPIIDLNVNNRELYLWLQVQEQAAGIKWY